MIGEASGAAVADSLKLHVEVVDREVIAELVKYEDGLDRDTFALGALRLGVLAIRQAKGELDAQTVRQEGERLIAAVRAVLHEHSAKVTGEVAASLKGYFDPASGLLPQRLESLVKRDGDLDALLGRHLAGDG